VGGVSLRPTDRANDPPQALYLRPCTSGLQGGGASVLTISFMQWFALHPQAQNVVTGLFFISLCLCSIISLITARDLVHPNHSLTQNVVVIWQKFPSDLLGLLVKRRQNAGPLPSPTSTATRRSIRGGKGHHSPDARFRRVVLSVLLCLRGLWHRVGAFCCDHSRIPLAWRHLSAVIPGPAIQVGLTDLDGRSPESITTNRRVVRNGSISTRGSRVRLVVMDSGLAG
jgi:hypothetical protein